MEPVEEFTGPCRVLLVEDDAEDAKLVKRFLEREPEFRVETANRLQEAVELLAIERFAAVLLDLNLPDSRGLGSVDFMKARWPWGPIIVLTGMDDTLLGIDAVRHGAQDYLTKESLSTELLVRTVRYALERHRFTYMLDSSKQTQEDLLLEFCERLRPPVSEILNAASEICEKSSDFAMESSSEVERMSVAASQLLTLMNNAGPALCSTQTLQLP